MPTCAPNDGRFLTFGGQTLATFVFDLLTFGVGSPAGDDTLHIRIFDGETSGLWDNDPGPGLEFTLFADPVGDTTGTFQVGQWSGDDMPDNDFFDIMIPNAPEAMAESGNYLYRMSVRNVDTSLPLIHNFKVLVIGENTSLFIFPGDQPFGYEASYRADQANGNDLIEIAANILYPTFAADPLGCEEFFNPLCTRIECCYYSTYDGVFDFFFFNENEGRLFIDFWDGDLDFGTQLPEDSPFNPGTPPFEDTDDPNTPSGLPIFADLDNTNPQGSYGANPPDDQSDPLVTLSLLPRIPNITYSLIDPNGVVYHNANPSATNEWELFQLNTEPGCAPDICDYEVEEIPIGIWNIRITGMDMWNINYIRAFDKIVGVDTNGEPVMPLDPIEPLEPPRSVNVPTFTEWGMLAVAFVLGAIGIYSLRRKRDIDSSSC